MDSAENVSVSLAPWDPEPAAYRSPEEVANYQQLRQIGALLGTAGMREDAIRGWTDRLQSISAIVEQGCCMNGVPGAGALLLDMLSDLLQDITHSSDPLSTSAMTGQGTRAQTRRA